MDSAFPKTNRFLYDDYMESDLYNSAGSSARGGGGPQRRQARDVAMIDVDDAYMQPSRGRRADAPLVRRRELEIEERGDDYGRLASDGAHARRFANALGIPPSTRIAPRYDDLDSFGVQRAPTRPIYRELPTARVAPLGRSVVTRRRVIADDYDDDIDYPRGRQQEVVEMIERVRTVPRRLQVVKKVPIQQRVIKKIFVERGSGFNQGVKRQLNITKKGGRVNAAGGIQKRTGGGGGNIRAKQDGAAKPKANTNAKPKLSAEELDRELEEYMRKDKHPRVSV